MRPVLENRARPAGAGERTRTPDLLITNSVEGRNLAPLRRFWAFLLHHTTAYDLKFSTVSIWFFRRVGLGVGQKERRHRNFPAPIL